MGPINLTKFVIDPFTFKAKFDFTGFSKVVKIQTRFLDNVLDVTLWPLEEQRKESADKRRIGVGFTGLGNALAMLNLKYDSDAGRSMARDIVMLMRDEAYKESVELAREKGKFPLFNAKKYLEEGTFASRLPEDIKALIKKHGIRNSHLLSIAPTGTVSLAFCDNASNGIEPPYSLAYNRKKRNGDGTTTTYPVIDHGLRVYISTKVKTLADALLDAIVNYKETFTIPESDRVFNLKEYLSSTSIQTALELDTDAHLRMLQVVQPFIDTSISKTVNIPADYPFEDFKHVYDKAWEYKLKGVSTYRPNNILGSVLSVGTATPKEEPKVVLQPDLDPLSVIFNTRPLGDLVATSKKIKYSGPSGDGTLFVSVSFIEAFGYKDGVSISANRPIEIFITVSPEDVPAEWVAAYARNLSLLARSGLSLLAKALQDGCKIQSDKGRVRYGWYEKADGSKVPRFHGSEVACISYAIQEILISQGYLDSTGAVVKNQFNNLTIKSKGDITITLPANPGVNTKVVIETVKEEVPKGNQRVPGKLCGECGDHAVIKKDGCNYCTNCGALGSCN